MTALVPHRHYVEALAMPRYGAGPLAPPIMDNPVKPAAFIVPTVICGAAAIISTIIMLAGNPNKEDHHKLEIAIDASLIAGGVALTTGLFAYGTATPVPQVAGVRQGFVNVGLGIQGQF
jgi:hypothetical protein